MDRVYAGDNCNVFYCIWSIYELPGDVANYPPLAQQFFLNNIKPSGCNMKEQWGSKVKSLLDELCGTNEAIVKAVIDTKGNAILYLDTEVMLLILIEQ